MIRLLADLVYPSIVRRRSRVRFDREAALWVGPATFAPVEVDQHPAVRAALSGVGAYYGDAVGGYGPRWRVVGAVLWVLPDRVVWEPQRYLGRGEAHRWEIPVEEVSGVEITGRRIWRTGTAVTRTVRGPIRFEAADLTNFPH